MLRAAACLVVLVMLAGCGSHSGISGPAGRGGVLPDVSAKDQNVDLGKYIKHVVIIVQENRSFNSFFMDYPGATTQDFGYEHDGTRVRLHRIRLNDTLTLNHDYSEAWAAYDGGKMDGFDLGNFSGGGGAGKYPYAFVKREDIAPYWTMAHEYVLADHMFPTMLSASYTAHLDLIAGTTDLNPSQAVIDVPNGGPWGCYAPAGTTTPTINPQRQVIWNGPFTCYTQFRTMADTLDPAGVSWKYYAPRWTQDNGGYLWSEFAAISNVFFGPDWLTKVVSPQTTILTDPGNGKLASVSWVMPDWADSDHSWNGSLTGPSWVASVVNAIGESPYWNSTAIFIVWDDWGGFFDPAVPPQLDFRGLGIRVPCLIISPYAKKNYVDQTQYEFGSILKFTEDAFHLPRLGTEADGYTDGRATSPVDAFDFLQKPRKFKPFYRAILALVLPPRKAIAQTRRHAVIEGYEPVSRATSEAISALVKPRLCNAAKNRSID